MAKKLGVAFGGSGAEGIACIGYVKAFEELDIKPDIISGTGVGGVIAAMYAAGMTSQDMIGFLQEIEFPGAKRPINGHKIKGQKYGILDGLGLEEYFQMVIPIKVFDRLYFPLKILAANYETGDEVVFSDGDVGRAVKAGVAVPGIFSPYEADGVTYLDGSCVDPIPFDVIRDDCDILVAIDPCIHQNADAGDLYVFNAFVGAYAAAKKALDAEKRKSFNIDLYERIVIKDISIYDFARYQYILDAVEENKEKFVIKLKEQLSE